MGFLQRGLLLYLAIAIGVTFASAPILYGEDNQADKTVLSWFNIEINQTSKQPYVPYTANFSYGNGTDGSQQYFDSAKPPSSGLGIFGFIDPIWQIWDWVRVFFKTIFSPFVVLLDPSLQLPTPIIFVFVIPLTFMFIVGLIMWIRGVTF